MRSRKEITQYYAKVGTELQAGGGERSGSSLTAVFAEEPEKKVGADRVFTQLYVRE